MSNLTDSESIKFNYNLISHRIIEHYNLDAIVGSVFLMPRSIKLIMGWKVARQDHTQWLSTTPQTTELCTSWSYRWVICTQTPRHFIHIGTRQLWGQAYQQRWCKPPAINHENQIQIQSWFWHRIEYWNPLQMRLHPKPRHLLNRRLSITSIGRIKTHLCSSTPLCIIKSWTTN